MTDTAQPALTKKDFASDQEVRWCPGCGDYAILNALQKHMAESGADPAKTVFVSGIGCSSRFPYYMNTYGFHTIHGRAPAVATGVKVANPDLDVWIVTGDGDSLSIGGNHLAHILRRNLDVNILMFNNEIYGLTKGQYSPTSPVGTKKKSTPMGSIDRPFEPAQFAVGAQATFVAQPLPGMRILAGARERRSRHPLREQQLPGHPSRCSSPLGEPSGDGCRWLRRQIDRTARRPRPGALHRRSLPA